MYYRIIMKRSTIGLPSAYKENLKALGLKKRGLVSYQKVSPVAAGMIAKVKELILLEVVENARTKAEERETRKGNPGYVVVNSS